MFVSIRLLFMTVVIICVMLSMGMFVHILVMSKEQILVSGLISKLVNLEVRFSVFVMLYELGSCIIDVLS
jgi:hypothetical protein